ncbi:MAG TPA: class I adenylate-forming enzyme family protein [Xanthobacteraceae bacterium]|nr:class I adenylate-forming enzyme family protein [Xanthobacteraceae bacterium]
MIPAAPASITLDDLFRRSVAQRPQAIALCDPPNRESLTDGAPRRLTFAQAEVIVSAIAERLRGMGLPAGSVVGIQLPNIAENILTILGVLRAGLVPAPLPQLWRRADAATALKRAQAKALVTCCRIGDFNHCELARSVAADVFSIRFVCAFGAWVSDGVVPLDDLMAAEPRDPPAASERDGPAGANIAVVTFETRNDGPVPVARSHLELLSAGIGVFCESRLERQATMLSTYAPASLTGLGLAVVPWLLAGGTLVLHHPFDADLLARQRREEGCGVLILPAAVVPLLAESGWFTQGPPGTVVAAWPAPERLAASAAWRADGCKFVDVAIFGEAGAIPAQRGHDGRPAPLRLGPVLTPRSGAGETARTVVVADLSVTQANTVALAGPMVPQQSFPPGIETSNEPHWQIQSGGLVDTGYTCRVEPDGDSVTVTGPPSGIVGVGGYRFALSALQTLLAGIDPAATLDALPAALTGQRLLGKAADVAAVQAALADAGANPLVVSAFTQNGSGPARH